MRTVPLTLQFNIGGLLLRSRQHLPTLNQTGLNDTQVSDIDMISGLSTWEVSGWFGFCSSHVCVLTHYRMETLKGVNSLCLIEVTREVHCLIQSLGRRKV